MIVEFMRNGRTYSYAVHEHETPPPTLKVLFKPCRIRPAFLLEIQHVGYDEIRMIHLYRPIREIHE